MRSYIYIVPVTAYYDFRDISHSVDMYDNCGMLTYNIKLAIKFQIQALY